MIKSTVLAQVEYLNSKSEKDRKEIGQYFTGAPVSNYMASLFDEDTIPDNVSLLDAGAGAGILTISTALYCIDKGKKSVHAVLYEIDDNALEVLSESMEDLKGFIEAQDGQFTYEIRNKDFVLDRPDQKGESYDISCINPPYFKYNSKSSPYAFATTDLYKGNPNIYASFMAVVIKSLKPKGQMVAIVPRSYLNGLYFKGFRQFMFQNTSLNKVHIFRSRNQVFKELAVLQENIICHYSKERQGEQVRVSVSNGHADFEHTDTNYYPTSIVIDETNDAGFIRVPDSKEDAELLEFVEHMESSFKGNGYIINTGPVVTHRTTEHITDKDDLDNTVPLLKMHNVKLFKTEWTGTKKKDSRLRLFDGHSKMTTKNQRFIVLKRFTSKEEARRLVAGIHSPKFITGEVVAFENHLNLVSHHTDELSEVEANGLALLLNSTVIDRYFRCISGNTQVNATEVRLLKMPSRADIRKIGEHYHEGEAISQQQVDEIVNKQLKYKV